MTLFRAQNSYAEPRRPSRPLFHNVELWIDPFRLKAATEIEDEPFKCTKTRVQSRFECHEKMPVSVKGLKNMTPAVPEMSANRQVEKCLAPTLSKGDIVIINNLSSHKGPRVEQLITATGAQLRYLPPYSPDMNPIEKAYSKLKAFLRKIAERTVAGLMNALEACAEIFKPNECVKYFKACGYDSD